jgi:squalene synthase HpnC
MSDSSHLRSGKGSRDENFPVASWLIKRRHRPVILAFYNFVRTADDIADHAALDSSEKLSRLDRLEASLLGTGSDERAGVELRAVLSSRGLPPRHAQDLLQAFRQDVVKLRYANWDELIGYCTLSAMPVGRFVLDVHGESHETWPASDALCAALQIINHLQDCAADYRNLDRVYIPLDTLAAEGLGVESLAGERASPALRRCLQALAVRTEGLLDRGRKLPASVRDTRLAIEISVIQAMAARLVQFLKVRDPLCEPVHLGKVASLATTLSAASCGLLRRALRGSAPAHRYQTP